MLLFSPLVIKNTTPLPILPPDPLNPDPTILAAMAFRGEVGARFLPSITPPGVSPSQALRDSLLALTSKSMQSGDGFAHGLADIIEAYVKAHLTALAANMDINTAIYSAHIHPVAGVMPAITVVTPPIPTPPLYT